MLSILTRPLYCQWAIATEGIDQTSLNKESGRTNQVIMYMWKITFCHIEPVSFPESTLGVVKAV